MKLSTFRYLWSQASANIRRSLSPSAAAVIVIALIVLGSMLAVIRNTQSVTRDLVMSFQIVAYMAVDSSARDTEDAASSISGIPGVVGVEISTKEAELERLISRFPSYRQVISSLRTNPLADAIVVDLDSPARAADVASVVQRIDGVDEVVYGTEAAERLAACAKGLGVLSLFGTVFLVLALSLVVGSVVGLTIEYREPEIEVASLVGASHWFIRWPFILEAFLLGVLAWLVGAAVVTVMYIPAVRSFQEMMPFVSFADSPRDIAVICVQLLAISLMSSEAATIVALERALASIRKR